MESGNDNKGVVLRTKRARSKLSFFSRKVG